MLLLPGNLSFRVSSESVNSEKLGHRVLCAREEFDGGREGRATGPREMCGSPGLELALHGQCRGAFAEL